MIFIKLFCNVIFLSFIIVLTAAHNSLCSISSTLLAPPAINQLDIELKSMDTHLPILSCDEIKTELGKYGLGEVKVLQEDNRITFSIFFQTFYSVLSQERYGIVNIAPYVPRHIYMKIIDPIKGVKYIGMTTTHAWNVDKENLLPIKTALAFGVKKENITQKQIVDGINLICASADKKALDSLCELGKEFPAVVLGEINKLFIIYANKSDGEQSYPEFYINAFSNIVEKIGQKEFDKELDSLIMEFTVKIISYYTMHSGAEQPAEDVLARLSRAIEQITARRYTPTFNGKFAKRYAALIRSGRIRIEDVKVKIACLSRLGQSL